MNLPIASKTTVKGCISKTKGKRVRPIHDMSTVNSNDLTVTFDESYDSSHVYDDVEDPKLTKVPTAPSRQEIEDHNVNHLPF